MCACVRVVAQARCDLRHVLVATPPGVLPATAVEALNRALADPAPRHARRAALLMGTHARLGSRSPIRCGDGLERAVWPVAAPHGPH